MRPADEAGGEPPEEYPGTHPVASAAADPLALRDAVAVVLAYHYGAISTERVDDILLGLREHGYEVQPICRCGIGPFHHTATCPSSEGIHQAAEAADREAATFWLIERGQPEKQVPTVWFAGTMDGRDVWTQAALDATRYPDKATAEFEIERRSGIPASQRFIGRAVEHGIMPPSAAADPLVADASSTLDVDGIRRAFLDELILTGAVTTPMSYDEIQGTIRRFENAYAAAKEAGGG